MTVLVSHTHTGSVTAADYTPALQNQFRVQMRLGMFDPDADQIYRQYTTTFIDAPPHRALALDAARQSIVLLKNAKNVRP